MYDVKYLITDDVCDCECTVLIVINVRLCAGYAEQRRWCFLRSVYLSMPKK